MSHTIHIEVDASLQDSWLIHRILNFKEDLHREFLRNGNATITDAAAVDRGLDPLTITIPSKRYLGPVSTFITKALQRNDVTESIRIQRVS